MNGFGVAALVFATLFLGGVLICGLVGLAQVKRGRLDRLQMKHHLRKIGLAGEGPPGSVGSSTDPENVGFLGHHNG